ncbi:PqqD family protein [Candidatus Bathyarchaeota archaeon]|nr:PqqD family protein [Candidatus Bathyarchaeota archaeon]
MPFPFFRKKKEAEVPPITREQFLQLVPLRNPALKWKRYRSGEVYIILEGPRRPARRGIASKLFPVASSPRTKRIILDKIGSFVWELCDGNNTIDDIITKLSEAHKLTRREAEIPLRAYLQTLAKRGFIGVLPKEALAKYQAEAKSKEDMEGKAELEEAEEEGKARGLEDKGSETNGQGYES